VRLWNGELQKLADELGIPITVRHLPPGTSKWNKIACSRSLLKTSAAGGRGCGRNPEG
jgi:hypothetical protein